MARQLINQPIAFPKTLPEGYQYLREEPIYNAGRHLNTGISKRIANLT